LSRENTEGDTSDTVQATTEAQTSDTAPDTAEETAATAVEASPEQAGGPTTGDSPETVPTESVAQPTDTAPVSEPPKLGKVFSLTEAAEAARVSRTTIRRYLDRDRFPNAYRNAEGQWRVPVADLEAAGLRLHRPAPPEGAPEPEVGDRAVELEREVAVLRERVAAAEAIAEERQRALEDLRVALRVLERGKPSEPAHSPQEATGANYTSVTPGEPSGGSGSRRAPESPAALQRRSQMAPGAPEWVSGTGRAQRPSWWRRLLGLGAGGGDELGLREQPPEQP
jgi:hypothetical protein